MATVPETQTAAVLHKDYGHRYVIERQWPVRAPKAGEVVVKLEASGICFGDLHARDGGPPAPLIAARPLVGGHEGVGHIVAVGDSAGSFNAGDRVGLGWRRSVCEDCCFCNDGEDNNCMEQIANGFSTDGTFQGIEQRREP
jgi:propanol-preferring alcohol dehydrogenase